MDIALGAYLHCTFTSGACLLACSCVCEVYADPVLAGSLCWARAMFTDGPPHFITFTTERPPNTERRTGHLILVREVG